ncbi:YnbE family lipoprotein [Nitrococcus mobilis]|uniref:YnbE-like lipoprotein n=1 Tax=Nitrococcus mobilis Nb-231 TaxID=314278 RepID=A4BUB8_9GAMM|nr:YnbE family lipoprotein [Nitrococcus mobilis]EAR20632.1 hypothetical protein NB231_01908 [Nitrococcus mobilis Nb-231]
MIHRLKSGGALLLVLGTLLGGCSPTVKLQAPDEPIRFDVNINITEQKRLQIDQELLELIKRNPELFGVTPEQLPNAATGSEK